ncbi:MAG TPA: DNA polymerase Y family protein [Kofleriaceae bacterium]|nr:DNA polymerase Y family protein [Kofleriaceae bacterium]
MRIACLDLPAFPLQLVWNAEPTWRDAPVVVIDHDRPQGQVLHACERARAAGVLVGQRYAYALSLCRDLRARVVAAPQITAAIEDLRALLHQFSPRVEPGEPGTFWLDGDGLARVFREAGDHAGQAGGAWGKVIALAIAQRGFHGAVVVGFSRFATYAIARATRRGGVTVLRSADHERTMADQVPLTRLDLDPTLRAQLAQLGVTAVGALVRLPGSGVLERFGREAFRLHQLAAGEAWDPIAAQPPPAIPDERVVLDDDETDVERIMFALKPPIDRVLERLAGQHRALTALHVELALKHAVGHVELRADTIRPAAPTLDGRALLRLVHLRLTGAPPSAPINALRVWADDAPATREQLALFAHKPRRDLRAADEAVARLRAELGDAAVVHAVLRDGHLPEAQFAWQPVHQVVAAQPTPRRVRPLVRRILAQPRRLPIDGRGPRDEEWLHVRLARGALRRVRGPYVVSGGWWAQDEVARAYHLVDLPHGERLWVFFDRKRKRWRWQGAVS